MVRERSECNYHPILITNYQIYSSCKCSFQRYFNRKIEERVLSNSIPTFVNLKVIKQDKIT